jgi:phosphocarrier protein
VVSRAVTVQNALGMHARAAARFARAAGLFQARILVASRSRVVDGKSIMGLLLLAAPRGAQITISAEGIDEREALDALCALVEKGFGEGTPRATTGPGRAG